jgi:hypothetical protein
VPTWSEIATEIAAAQVAGDQIAFDTVRRKYLAAVAAHTGRDTILYASRFIQPGSHNPEAESIIDEDLQALLEVLHGLTSPNLDIILHSPGGSAEATEAIVVYLRKRYKHIRVVVPHVAMSAATMWACAADTILMGPQSSLGPIDPQMRVVIGEGALGMVPAQAILDQFEMARQEASKPGGLSAWVPILRQYGVALLIQSQDALDLSEELVKEWLRKYMLAGTKYAARDARRIARALADHQMSKSHGRHLDRDRARTIGGGHVGLKVENMESDRAFEDATMSTFHAAMHVFAALPHVAKIVESHKGRAWVKIAGVVPVVRPSGPARPGGPASAPTPGPAPVPPTGPPGRSP